MFAQNFHVTKLGETTVIDSVYVVYASKVFVFLVYFISFQIIFSSLQNKIFLGVKCFKKLIAVGNDLEYAFKNRGHLYNSTLKHTERIKMNLFWFSIFFY